MNHSSFLQFPHSIVVALKVVAVTFTYMIDVLVKNCWGSLSYFVSCTMFQLILVFKAPGLDPDWLMAERGSQSGKVPVTYLEVLE